MPSTDRRTASALLGLGVMVAAGVAHARDAAPQQPFPYDPLCRWGRLSDGKGYVIRCLTREEAVKLGAPDAAEGKPAPPAEGGSAADAAKGPIGPEPTPSAAYQVVLGPVAADKGEFPQAVQSLAKGQAKLEACVAEHGGTTANEAKIDVRFLVRGRGRAEGVVVKKHVGLSKEAATCIANVIDRRFVGYPAEEMVGASMVITVKKR